MNFRQATQEDNRKLLTLLSDTPQKGLVTIGFERSPNYFHSADITSYQRFVGVLEDDKSNEIVAMSAFGKRPVYVNGNIKHINYGNDVRIRKKYRGQGVLARLFKEHQRFFTGKENICQLVILENNIDSLTKIANNWHGILKFQPYGDLVTHIISTRYDFAPNSGTYVRNAHTRDIPAIQKFFDSEAKKKQFYPYYDFSKIGSDNYFRNLKISDYYIALEDDNIVGLLGVWKQDAFKQTRIIKFPLWVRLARPFNNLWSILFGGFVVPNEGNIIEYATLHTVLTKNNSSLIMSGLLKKVRSELNSSGETTMLLGLMDNDPLRASLKGFRGRTIKSKHYLMSTDKNSKDLLDSNLPVYLELARL